MATTDASSSELLKLLEDPFSSQMQQTSLWVAFGSSVGITLAIAIGFSLVRPYNTVVYAPKLKHADEKRAPPPLGRGFLAWIKPLWSTTEQDLVPMIGLDAVVFLRFTRMCRNLFVLLSIVGCAILIPVNYTSSPSTTNGNTTWITRITPSNVFGSIHWATVVVAWLFNMVTCGFLWWNYKKVLHLRRQFFESDDYQHSLHARTLMLYDIPKKRCSDEGISKVIDRVAPNSSFSRTVIARDVKILPELINEHNETVKKLERQLAKYLKDPHNLPAARPVCSPSKKDPSYPTYPKGQKVDAIEYLTQRIKTLEMEIKEVRQSVDKRGSMGYGFASYVDIREAHGIAYVARNKKPEGASIRLAPRPSDIIWDNIPLSRAMRRVRRAWNSLWIVAVTLLWVGPNAFIAIFLVNLGQLGKVWPAFQTTLSANMGFWSIVQGIASPAITSLVYLVVPIIFRRLSIKAGDRTKTGRERHVTAKLFSFFVFNYLLVFSLFSALWSFTATIVKNTSSGENAWEAFIKADFGDTVFLSLCNVSPFWVTWLLQRQLGAAIDLAQLWTLFWTSIRRKFSSLTPREMIELTAPPPFDYAVYFNNYLFYGTVALGYAFIQPLVLPSCAFYFCIDTAFRKYLLLYVFVTKQESGGSSWRLLFNRFCFSLILSNLVVFLTMWVRGVGTHHQAFAVAPLPVAVIAFKTYCMRTFDHPMHYYSTRLVQSHTAAMEDSLNVKEQSRRNDRLAARFGHPALYAPLKTPMVHAKAQNILASVYRGRLSDGREGGAADMASVSGYSDTFTGDIALESLGSGGKAGKRPGGVGGGGGGVLSGFEVVPESRLDFEFYKNRVEFAADHGDSDLFGQPSDVVRTGTPGSTTTDGSGSRPGTPRGGMGFSVGGGHRRNFLSPHELGDGTTYPHGYTSPTQQPTAYPGKVRFASPVLRASDAPSRTGSPVRLYGLGGNDSESSLMPNAARVPSSTPAPPSMGGAEGDHGRLPSGGNPRAPGTLGGGPQGYPGPSEEEDSRLVEEQDPMLFNYFRGGRTNNSSSAAGGRSGNGMRGGS